MRGIFTRAEAERVASKMHGIASPARQQNDGFAHLTPVEQVSCLELSRYMRNQLLRDSDVMSMASGLELRVPFVDSVLVEKLFSIAPEVRLRTGKQLLLEAVPEVPQWIREQPKRGFRFPFQEWLASDWKEPFEALESKAGMPLDNWYEKWSLFLLEHAAKRIQQK
jgi:asparagine synthase (glutamine-hydrolysing)